MKARLPDGTELELEEGATGADAAAAIGAGLTGVLLAPMAAPYLWVALIGAGQGGCFALGLNLFVASGLSGMSVLQVAKAAVPSALVLLVALLLVTYVPFLSLVLVP